MPWSMARLDHGEDNEDVVSKHIPLQRGGLSFWKVITLIGDFLAEPLWIALHAAGVVSRIGRPGLKLGEEPGSTA